MSRRNLRQRLFPKEPRDFYGRRILRSALRSIHILGGGVLIGAVLFSQAEPVIELWWRVATLSGLLLFATDLHASLAVLFEWRGLSIIAKITLLLLVPLLPGFEVALLVAILLIGSLSSHLSRRFRHRLWLALPDITQDQRHG